MRKLLLLFLLVFSVTQIWSQNSPSSSSKIKSKEDRNYRIPLIGESAPSFTAESTNGTINFPSDFGRKWKILLSHPQDFTPVCTTEILELAYLQEEFEKNGVKIAVISTDPVDIHVQWKKAMENLNLNNRGTVEIKFPLIDDENIAISKQYGMIHSASNSTKTVRGVFVIDPNNIIQAVYFYPMQVGRSTDELLRVVAALKLTSDNKVLTPANWKAGNDLLVPIPANTVDGAKESVPEGYYSPAWYLMYKRANKE